MLYNKSEAQCVRLQNMETFHIGDSHTDRLTAAPNSNMTPPDSPSSAPSCAINSTVTYSHLFFYFFILRKEIF